MHSVLEVAASQDRESRGIGMLNEGALHAQLKDWYRRQGSFSIDSQMACRRIGSKRQR